MRVQIAEELAPNTVTTVPGVRACAIQRVEAVCPLVSAGAGA